MHRSCVQHGARAVMTGDRSRRWDRLSVDKDWERGGGRSTYWPFQYALSIQRSTETVMTERYLLLRTVPFTCRVVYLTYFQKTVVLHKRTVYPVSRAHPRSRQTGITCQLGLLHTRGKWQAWQPPASTSSPACLSAWRCHARMSARGPLTY